MSRTHRHLTITGLAQTAETRTELFEGREHLVVPVIALIGDSVVWASNAPGPEFIPSDVIARSAIEWAGRPVVGDHPVVNGKAISANDPRICESRAFGRLANPTYGPDKKLRLEAWLDKTKAPKVGELESDVLTRINKGETVEVSIGAFVEIEKQEGTSPNGQDYVGVWTDIGSDHLAMLPAGVGGACSVDMGCGAPRINKSGGLRAMTDTEKNKGSGNRESSNGEGGNGGSRFLRRIMSAIGFRSNVDDEGVSDSALRSALFTALHDSEPGFDWIVEVYQESSTVIYTTFTEDQLRYWRRTFIVADNGVDIQLSDDREQVEPVTRWELVAAQDGNGTSNPTTATLTAASQHECTCQSTQSQSQLQSQMANLGGESNMPTPQATTTVKSGYIDKLITLKMFTEEERKTLEALSENSLKALSEEGNSGSNNPAPASTKDSTKEATVTATAETKESPLTEQQWLEQAPESVRELVNRYQREEEEYRTSLISTLSKAQTAFSSDRLKTMSTDDLKALSVVTKIESAAVTRDYVGRGASAVKTQRDFTPPDPYNLNGNTQSVTDKAATN